MGLQTPTVSETSLRDKACNDSSLLTLYTPNVYNRDSVVNAVPTAIADVDVPTVDWEQFRFWLLRKGLNREYVRRLVKGAQKWCHCIFSGNLAEVELSGSKHMVLSALSQLSKFVGAYSYFKRLKEEAGLKWHDSDNGFVFTRIYGEETHGIEDWLRKCCERLDYEHFFALKWLALSGLRTGEGYNSLEIVRKHGLDGYLNKDLGVLEHFRYPETFLRRSKKAFLSVVDDEVVAKLESYRGKSTYWKLRKRLQKYGMRLRTYDLRKNWASFMCMNGVAESVVDMFQGRIGTSIFQRSYFRPSMRACVEQVRKVLKKYEAELYV